MKFHKLTELKKTVAAPSGQPTVKEYIEKIDKNGSKYLEESGETNLYEKIQASHEETKIYNIIQRYEQGDDTALNRITGMYIDSTGMPKSIMEAHQRLEQIQNDFEKLPLEIRKDFNHNPSEFISRMSSGEGMEVFDKHAKKMTEKEIKKEAKTEVIENE